MLERGATGIYNCGTGRQTSINQLAHIVREISGKALEIVHDKPREGDIRHSYANIDRALKLGYTPTTNLKEDLRRYFF